MTKVSNSEWRLLKYVVLFVIITRVLLMFRSEAKIYTRPYLEDTFYLFTCAEHLAAGEGFTCDGKQPTSGVQPLIVLLYAPLFLIAGANKLLALRLGFLLIAAFDSFCVIFIARLVRLLQKKPDEEVSWTSPPIIAAMLWAVLYTVFIHAGSGLETGIYSVMLLGSLCYYAKLSRLRTHGNDVPLFQWILCGVILGVTVLARIDAVFLVIAIAGYEIYRFRGKGVAPAAAISIFSFLLSSPWWWYNYNVFGSLMPQSGISESMETGILAENIRRGAIALGDILTVFFFLPDYDLPNWVHYLWFLGIVGIVIWTLKRYSLISYVKDHFSLSPLTPFYYFSVALVIYYIFFFSAPHFLARYFQPLRIIWIVLFVCSVPKLILVFKNFYLQKKNIALICIWIFSLSAIGFNASRYLYYYLMDRTSGYYLMGKFALLHPSEKIGMDQSGTAGFMSANVVNLDGKVNFAALQAKKHNDIGGYIEKEKLDYLADWRDFTDPMIASSTKHGGRFHEIDSIGRIVIFKRVK